MTETYLTTRQLADMLGVSVGTLRVWRHQGVGPRYLKLGGRKTSHCRYAMSDIEKWKNGNVSAG